jgi:hypothetical protein
MENPASLLRQIAEQLMAIADGYSGEESEVEESPDSVLPEPEESEGLPKATPKAAILAILSKRKK